jgi:hypothetical protein
MCVCHDDCRIGQRIAVLSGKFCRVGHQTAIQHASWEVRGFLRVRLPAELGVITAYRRVL